MSNSVNHRLLFIVERLSYISTYKPYFNELNAREIEYDLIFGSSFSKDRISLKKINETHETIKPVDIYFDNSFQEDPLVFRLITIVKDIRDIFIKRIVKQIKRNKIIRKIIIVTRRRFRIFLGRPRRKDDGAKLQGLRLQGMVYDIKSLLYFKSYFKLQNQNFKKMVSNHKYSHVVCATTVDGVALSAIKYRELYDYKIICIPWCLANFIETSVYYRNMDRQVISNIGRRLFAKIRPNYVRHNKSLGRDVLVNNAAESFALAILGMEPENPGHLIGGYFDFAVAESKFVKEFYVKEGAKSQKIFTLPTRDVSSIKMEKEIIERKLRSKYNIGVDRKISIIAVPRSDFLGSYFFQDTSLKKGFIKEIIEFLEARNYFVLLSIHPDDTSEESQYLQDYSRIILPPNSLHEYVMGCEMFIAENSGTFRLSLGYFIKSVDLAFLTYSNNYYKESANFYEIRKIEELSSILEVAIASGTKYNSEKKYILADKQNLANRFLESVI